MPQGSFLTWNNFVNSICVRGDQRVHRISSAPLIDIFWDGTEGRTGLWVETDPDTVLPTDFSQLSAIRTALVDRGGKPFVEVSSSAHSLQRQFFHFAMSVAGSVLTDRRTPVDAIAAELQQFDDLVHCRTGLSSERQIGLFGELLFLERLIGVHSIAAVDGWVGPLGEPHDFIIGTMEYEVKTTSTSRRIHTINGESQLLPSAGCSLFIVSVLLGPGGGSGDSLATAVQRIQGAVAHSHHYSARFRDSLQACGYRDEDAVHYSRRFNLRRAMAVVPVIDPLPRLTRPRIAYATGAESHRIEGVSYDLNVEGLEFEDGSNEFRSAIVFESGDL